MNFETERLILRPWLDSDAQDLYEYAKDPLVGPSAGWPVHTSVENSLEIIRNILAVPETYAVVLKETKQVIGSIGLMIGKNSHISIPEDEAEIGFWIGSPHWGKGYIPEAVKELLRYSFVDLHMKKVWCGYYDGNEKSKRTQEKCGFQYVRTIENIHCKLLNEIKTEHINCLTFEQWQK